MRRQNRRPQPKNIAKAQPDSSHDVTLRVNNLRPMKKFYQDSLGFELLGEFPSAALLRRGARSGMQSQMLGLLQRSLRISPECKTSGRIAFLVPVLDCDVERKRLESLGLRVDASNHSEFGKRSLRFRDPEGNEVELLCAK